jgi:hypothetical protein
MHSTYHGYLPARMQDEQRISNQHLNYKHHDVLVQNGHLVGMLNALSERRTISTAEPSAHCSAGRGPEWAIRRRGAHAEPILWSHGSDIVSARRTAEMQIGQ